MGFTSKNKGMACQPKVLQMIWFAFEPQEPLFCCMQDQTSLGSYACASYSIKLMETLFSVGFEVRFGFVLITTQHFLAGLNFLRD